MAIDNTLKIDGKALLAEVLAITDPGERMTWLKRRSANEIDALMKADGPQHYRYYTSKEQADWDFMCGRRH